MIIEFLKSLLYGIVEGITEWLPISSTGHLILLNEWLPFRFTDDATLAAEFWEMFEVVIQLGAILAVVILFWGRLWPFGSRKTPDEKKQTWMLWLKVIIGCIPAGLAGVIGDKILEKATGRSIDGWLYNAYVVAVALIVYGVAFILIEKLRKPGSERIHGIGEMSCRTALLIGLFQMLSIIPGTSRSGSTILGAMLLGLSRTAAAEFSFFMAVPVMVGASGIKLLGFASYLSGSGTSLPGEAWGILAVGCVVSFAVSMVAIRFLMDFVKRHSFSAFGYYRIALGALVLLYFGLVK